MKKILTVLLTLSLIAAMCLPGLAAEESLNYDESSPIGSEFQQIYWNGIKFNNYEGGESPLTALSGILQDGKVNDAGGTGFKLGLEGWAGFNSEITAFGCVINDTVTWDDAFGKGSDDTITRGDAGGQYAEYYSVEADISKLTGLYTVGVAAKLADGRVVLLNSTADPELNTFISFIGPSQLDPGDLQIETGEDVDKVPGPVIFFDDEGEYTPFIIGEHDISEIGYDDELGCLLIHMENAGDPYFTFSFKTLITNDEMEEISADDYPVISLGIRHNANGTMKGQFFYGTKDYPGYSESQSFQVNYERTTDYQPVYVDLRNAEFWTGDVDNCRLDPFASSIDPCDFEVYYIAFFKTMAGAVEFGENWANAKNTGTEMGPVATATAAPATEVPVTAEPTGVPSASEPAEAPTDAPVTDVPANSEQVSEPTKAPETDGENEKGGLPTGAVIGIIAGAVAVIAAVVAVILSKKKKG